MPFRIFRFKIKKFISRVFYCLKNQIGQVRIWLLRLLRDFHKSRIFFNLLSAQEMLVIRIDLKLTDEFLRL